VTDAENAPKPERSQLFVCVSCRCRGSAPAPEGQATDGRKLYEALASLLEEMGEAAPVQLIPTLCFANCERGCSAGIAAPGKWSYLMGELTPDQAEDLLAYCRAYSNAKTGVVLPSGRPASLAKSVIARFPAHFTEFKEAAE
jgi:predicted metal-binding protein